MEIPFFKRREDSTRRKIEYEPATYIGYCRSCGATLITLTPTEDVFQSLKQIEGAIEDHKEHNPQHEPLIGKLMYEGTSAIKNMGTHISEFETLPKAEDF